MKKITILALHLGYGGIERCISDLSNSLSDKYEINIVSTYKIYDMPPYEFNNIKIDYLIDTDLALRVERYKAHFLKLRFIKLFKELYKDYLKKGKIIKLISDTFNSMKIVIQKKKVMIDYIKKCDSDVIISTRDIHNEWLGKYAKEGILKIGWEHNHHHNNEKYIKKIVKSVQNLDYLVLVSKDLTKFYSEKLTKTNCKCIYIPNSLTYFPEKVSDLETQNIVSVGRLSPEKGYLDLIDVFKLVNQIYPNSILNIIGDGPDRDVLNKKIKNEKLEDVIKLHGFQNRDYINEIYKKSSVFVMSSHTESFGIVLLEAFSFGIPCVAFDSAEGANELIDDNWDGYLVKNRDKEKMAKRICELLGNINRRIIMGANGVKKANQYNIETIKEEWIKIIEK